MTRFTPVFGPMTIFPDFVPETRKVSSALLNGPEKGTEVVATLQGMTVRGKVVHVSAEYQTITIKHDVWVDHHCLGTAKFSLDLRLGWVIELPE